MASTAAGGVHRHAVAATVVGEEVESRRRHLVVGEEVRPAAVGHDDLERVAGQRRAGRIGCVIVATPGRPSGARGAKSLKRERACARRTSGAARAT